MPQVREAADAVHQRQHRLDQHALVPRPTRAQLEVGGSVDSVEAAIGEGNGQLLERGRHLGEALVGGVGRVELPGHHLATSVEQPAQLQADDPAVALERSCNRAILRQCLLTLSLKHAEVIDLVYYQNRSVREVAAIINIPENTVKTRMHLARKQLARMLAAAGYMHAAP